MDTRQMLVDTAERIFADLCDKALLDRAEQGEFPAELWATIQANGFHEIALPDNGIELADAFAVLKAAGRFAVPLPLAEIVLANRWLASSEGFASIGVCVGENVVEVPWGRHADLALGLDRARNGYLLLQPGKLGAGGVTEGRNLAGEARDTLRIPAGAEAVAVTEPAFDLLALGRTVAMAGCLERMLELTLQYANEREQFGRPIAKFQAIQHNLAVFAGEVAAATRAADAAIDALGGDRFELEVAAAKARVGEAAGIAAEIAHQVHGAMGYTHEHQLHHFTRRVWAWRDEYGGEAHWQEVLGRHLAGVGAEHVWDFLATAG